MSQIGNFSPSEREIFHRIVRMWAPSINYQTVLGIISSESVNAKKDIESLMKKLRNGKSGLLMTQVQENERKPYSITLCNPDDFFFYQKVLEEELTDVVASILNPLPSKDILQLKGIEIPSVHITVSDFANLARNHATREPEESAIYELTVEGCTFLISSNNVKRFVTIVLAKLQAVFQNTTLASYIAQLRNQALMELKRQLEGRDPSFWLQFTENLSEHHDVIKQNNKIKLDNQVWPVIGFFKSFLYAQAAESQKRRKADEDRALDMKTILEFMRTANGYFRSEDEFADILVSYKKKYEDNFVEFKKVFETLYLQAPERKSLPVLVHLGRAYIHQDNVHAYFIHNLERIGKDLFAIYIKNMDHYLKRPSEGPASVFYSKDNFDSDIAEQVKVIDPALFELLQRPNLVAEAIILSIKKHRDVKSSDDLKTSLTPFFHPDKIRFRDYHQLFGLNIQDLFKFAWLRLSIIRQIILKISGKYESIKGKFDEFSGSFRMNSDHGTSTRAGSSTKDEKAKRRDEAETRRKRIDASNNKKTSSSKVIATAAPKKDRNYSNQEKDTAWSAFGKTIKKD